MSMVCYVTLTRGHQVRGIIIRTPWFNTELMPNKFSGYTVTREGAGAVSGAVPVF